MPTARKELIQKNKTLARIALYGLPVALVVGALTIIRLADITRLSEASWVDEDFASMQSVQVLQEYLRFDTTYPDGNEIPAAEYIAGLLSADGIAVEIERLGRRHANLIATLEGDDPNALGLHGHVDTEPVRRPGAWRVDPFGGVLDPPFIYGRGAFDMKSVTVAQVMAMLDLKRRMPRPGRTVKLLLTSDEERDSWLGTRRLLKVRPELRNGLWAVLTEGGAVEAVSVDTAKYWGTEFQQKRFVDIWVCGSDPARLSFLRNELHERRTGWSLDPDIAMFLPIYGPTRDRPITRDLFSSPQTMIERLRAHPVDVGPTVLPPNVDSMMRSEVVAFPVEEDATGGYRFRAILHLLPKVQVADVWDELIGDRLKGFTYRVEEVHPSVEGSDPEHEAFRRIDEIMGEVYPEMTHGPLFVPYSATDARYFRQYGIPAYGFSPFHILTSDSMKMRGADERMPAPAFLAGVELYKELVFRLAGEVDR